MTITHNSTSKKKKKARNNNRLIKPLKAGQKEMQ
jgi:hypothetical protein